MVVNKRTTPRPGRTGDIAVFIISCDAVSGRTPSNPKPEAQSLQNLGEHQR